MDRSDFQFENDPLDDEGWNSDPFQEIRLDVPLGDVDEFPQRCVSISNEWVPIVLSALERLKYGDMWSGDADDIKRAYQNISTLQDLLGQGECEGGNMNYECYGLPLHSPIIDWHPNDPYDSPDFTPFGYSCPPWHVADAPNPIAGTRIGDVYFDPLCALIGFPPVIPFSGVPRLQITVQGPADVDIEFVDVFQGGIAVIFVDGLPANWHSCQLYSLTDLLNVEQWSDLFAIGIDALTKPVVQDQISIAGAGPHTVEIQFFPRVTLDTNIGWGGGIRSLQICSTEEQVDLSSFVTDIRINGGTVEKQIAGVWSQVDVADNADLLAEGELRDDGCQLQYYDLTDHSWHDIDGADYLSVSDPCDITDTLTIRHDNTPNVYLRDAAGTHWMQALILSAAQVWRSSNSLQVIAAVNKAMLNLQSSGEVEISTNATFGVSNGGVTIFNDLNKPALIVRNQNANSPDSFQVWDKNIRVTNEINHEGWFSAIQQLIVNDWSSVGTKRGLGRILGQWADSTDATRKGRMILQADDWNGVREGLRVEADGGYPMLGFFGGSAITQPIVIGSDAATALQSLLTALSGMNLIDDQSTFGALENPYGETPMQYTDVLYNFDDVLSIPFVWSSGGGFGSWIQGEGFVSALSGGTPNQMRLHVGTTTKAGLEVWRISGELLVADGAAGGAGLRFQGPGGLSVFYDLGQVNGPELFTFDIAPAFQYLSNQGITFEYSEETSDAALQVTLQKLRVLYKGIQPMDYIGAGNDINVYNFTVPDFA